MPHTIVIHSDLREDETLRAFRRRAFIALGAPPPKINKRAMRRAFRTER